MDMHVRLPKAVLGKREAFVSRKQLVLYKYLILSLININTSWIVKNSNKNK